MARIAIIGSGVVGQATGKSLAKQGHLIIFSDTDPAKLKKLSQEGYQTSAPEALEKEQIDIFFISVSTPTEEGKGIRLDFVEAAAKTLGSGALRRLNTYSIVVVKSTLPPGTTSHLVIPILERYSGKHAGKDFGVVFEPEFLREKTALEDALAPRLIVIGSDDPHAAHVLEWVRLPYRRPIIHTNIEEAELEKYIHNLYNATKISFFNEMRFVSEKLDVDAEKVFGLVSETAEASWNRLYGTRDFGPFDGMCLPKDTSAFLRFAKEKMFLDLPLLQAVITVNEITSAKKKAPKKILPSFLSLTVSPHKALKNPAESRHQDKKAHKVLKSA